MEIKQPGPDRRRVKLFILAASALLTGVVAWYGYNYFWGGNFDVVVPGEVYRSAQPTGKNIDAWAGQYGLKTIINLRGESNREDYAEEILAAKKAGLKTVNIRCSAAHLPSSPVARQLIAALEKEPRPMLIHCAHGADRTGLASVLAAMAIGGQDYQAAKGQMSARYGHIDPNPEHIGGMLNAYEDYCKANNRPTGGWAEFRNWALNEYHPAYFFVEITPPEIASLPAGKNATVKVTITNRSVKTLPLADQDKKIFLACFRGSSLEESPDKEFGPRLPMSGKNLAPGESITVDYLIAPADAGKVMLHFDLLEDGRSWFARQGSPVPDWPVEFTEAK